VSREQRLHRVGFLSVVSRDDVAVHLVQHGDAAVTQHAGHALHRPAGREQVTGNGMSKVVDPVARYARLRGGCGPVSMYPLLVQRCTERRTMADLIEWLTAMSGDVAICQIETPE
jgi:hypothetical protein